MYRLLYFIDTQRSSQNLVDNIIVQVTHHLTNVQKHNITIKLDIHSIVAAHIPVIASMDTRAFNAKRIGMNAGHRRVKMEAFASMELPSTIAVVQMDSRVTHKTRIHNSIK